MLRLSIFQHPIPQSHPPHGYGWSDRPPPLTVNASFRTGIDSRDIFRGEARCIVCGYDDSNSLEHCHVVGRQEKALWRDLKARGWIPQEAKNSPNDPRNGLLMCPNHHRLFDTLKFFIRYVPSRRRFVLVNYSGINLLAPFHGRAVALDIRDPLAPFPSLFIIHEMRAVGCHPFQSISLGIPSQVEWQNWILLDGVFDVVSGTLRRT